MKLESLNNKQVRVVNTARRASDSAQTQVCMKGELFYHSSLELWQVCYPSVSNAQAFVVFPASHVTAIETDEHGPIVVIK